MIEVLPFVASVLAAAAAPVLVAARGVRRWAGRRRNATYHCADCGAPWRELSNAPRYLVEGLEICRACAERRGRRLSAALLSTGATITVAVVVTAVGVGTAVAHYGRHVYMWYHYVLMAVPPVSLGAVAVAALKRMKRVNRQALAARAASELFDDPEPAAPQLPSQAAT
jgi:hypothetical protein